MIHRTYERPPHTPSPLAYDADELAGLLGISVRHLRRMNTAGLLPKPVRFGRSTRWVAETIQQWLRAGSPSRAEWESIESRNVVEVVR